MIITYFVNIKHNKGCITFQVGNYKTIQYDESRQTINCNLSIKVCCSKKLF